MQKNENENFISAMVVGPRKRAIGLVVPATSSAYTNDVRVADILSKEMIKIKTKYSHFDLKYEEEKNKLRKKPYLDFLDKKHDCKHECLAEKEKA